MLHLQDPMMRVEHEEDQYLSLHEGMFCVLSLHALYTFIVCFAEKGQGSDGEGEGLQEKEK